MKLLTMALVIVLILILPTIIIGEIAYLWSRNKDYGSLEGYTGEILQSKDKKSIQVWYTNNSEKLVIVIHGHGDHSLQMRERYEGIFAKLGYDLLFVDLRNHGKSERSVPVTLGVLEANDVEAALNWANNGKWNEIILFGTSMGAVASMLAQINTKIADKIILDSMYLDFRVVMNGNLKKNYIIQPWRFLVILYLRNFRYKNLDEPDLNIAFNELELPTLVIHGTLDKVSSIEIIQTIDNFNKTNVETISIENGTHSRLFLQKKFNQSITNFLEES